MEEYSSEISFPGEAMTLGYLLNLSYQMINGVALPNVPVFEDRGVEINSLRRKLTEFNLRNYYFLSLFTTRTKDAEFSNDTMEALAKDIIFKGEKYKNRKSRAKSGDRPFIYFNGSAESGCLIYRIYCPEDGVESLVSCYDTQLKFATIQKEQNGVSDFDNFEMDFSTSSCTHHVGKLDATGSIVEDSDNKVSIDMVGGDHITLGLTQRMLASWGLDIHEMAALCIDEDKDYPMSRIPYYPN